MSHDVVTCDAYRDVSTACCQSSSGDEVDQVCTYSGVKVFKEDKVIAVVDVFDGVVQVGVELVSCLRCQGKGWGIGADKCY